jgi:hypothetical protein
MVLRIHLLVAFHLFVNALLDAVFAWNVAGPFPYWKPCRVPAMADGAFHRLHNVVLMW